MKHGDNVITIFEANLMALVKYSPCAGERPSDTDIVMGHEYESDGRYQKFYFPADPIFVAKFITKSDKHKLLTNSNDYALLFCAGKEVKKSVLHKQYMEILYAELSKYTDTYSDFDDCYKNYWDNR